MTNLEVTLSILVILLAITMAVLLPFFFGKKKKRKEKEFSLFVEKENKTPLNNVRVVHLPSKKRFVTMMRPKDRVIIKPNREIYFLKAGKQTELLKPNGSETVLIFEPGTQQEETHL